ncbi:hypothetical protein niasHS_003373 [Heterodera schachtii]|uniref:Uncharacterized protein n=1 Tax=Heterodera schachtii TaxID=97005 RepID=A0ABD2KHM6_HETSC
MSQFGPAFAANANNPYAHFKCCCATFNIKDHAQFCGVLSFALFLCLVLISMMLFGSLSLFYIFVGVVVYILLMKTLFGVVNKLSLLFYIFFEAIQIGFYLVLILYIIVPLLFLQIPRRRNCQNVPYKINGSIPYSEICDEPRNSSEDYVELLLFVSLLASIKLHFARVFAHFYRYLTWNEQCSVHRAQYINGRGIHITMDQPQFAASFSPHYGWDTHIVKGSDRRGQNETNNPNQLPITELPPTYAQVIGQNEEQLQRNEQRTNGQGQRSTIEPQNDQQQRQ